MCAWLADPPFAESTALTIRVIVCERVAGADAYHRQLLCHSFGDRSTPSEELATISVRDAVPTAAPAVVVTIAMPPVMVCFDE